MDRGLVLKSTGSWYEVRRADGSMVECRIKGKFRTKGIDTTNPVSVGDWVQFALEEDGTGVIDTIEERKNYIIRKSVNLSKRAHIIASNIDQAFLLVTLADPVTSTGFIDRFLITAEAYHIPVKIVFNKVDIYDEATQEQLEELMAIYTMVGYDCYCTSLVENEGVEVIRTLMQNKVSLVSGHSGVGKSTLINLLDANLDIRVGEVSEAHHKGKHTTTFAEMHELAFGGFIIDTPGIKGFGIIDLEKEELSHYFLEMRELLHECKFNNCVHINEPKCAVKAAVEEGEVAESRYINYLSIYYNDENEAYR